MGAYWFSTFLEYDKKCSFGEVAVHDERFVREMFGPSCYMNMSTDGFILTPGYVMIDLLEPLASSPSKKQICENYIKRGCTLLIIQHPVSSLRNYRHLYDTFKKTLVNLPIDFMILPVIPARLVKPEMVRFFAREGSPFLCIEVESEEDFSFVTWEWLVQAQAHKRIPLTISVKDQKNTSINYSEIWSSVSNQYGIIKLTDLQDDEVISEQNLRDSGIFPNNGGLVPGGYADYNLFLRDQDTMVDDREKFRYHSPVPNVTVMKGKVMQVNQTIVDLHQGSYQQVKIHKHFV